MTDQQNYPGFAAPPGAPSINQPPPPTFGATPTPAGQPDAGGRWPKKAKLTAGILAVLLVGGGVAAGVLVSSARSDADDAKAQLAGVTQTLGDVDADADSIRDQIDDLVAEQTTSLRDKAKLQATIDSQTAEIANLTTQLEDADAADAAALQDKLDETEQRLADTEAALAQVEADLEAAQASGGSAAPFTVEAGKVPLQYGNFAVTTNRVTCEGFADSSSACPDTFNLTGRMYDEAGTIYMEFANVAKVPIGSFDGFNYNGSTAATGDSSATCNGQALPTTFTVQIAPVQYSIASATQSVVASAFSFTWTMTTDGGSSCEDSNRVYTGTIELL